MVREISSRDFAVSVVVPAFNVEGLVTRAIDSLLAQVLPPSEIIVVDDGSTDGTPQAVQAYGDRVRYIHQENSGPSVARNTGIGAATSEWVAFVDSDDVWEPDKLAADSRIAGADRDLSWIISNHFLCVFGDDHRFPRFDPDIGTTRLDGKTTHHNFLEALTWGIGWDPLGIVAKKHLLEEAGGFQPGLNYGEDLDLCLRIASRHPRIGIQPEPVAVHFIERPEGLCLRRSIPEQMRTLRGIFEAHAASAARDGRLRDLERTIRTIVQDNMATLLRQGRRIESVKVASTFRDLLTPSYLGSFFTLLCLPKVHRNRLYDRVQWRIRG